jgi:hypothetical protein
MRPAARQSIIPASHGIPMQEVLKSNNPVELSYAQALLKDAGIACVVFDDHMSVLDGSMVILPRRIMVDDEDLSLATTILGDGLKAVADLSSDDADET